MPARGGMLYDSGMRLLVPMLFLIPLFAQPPQTPPQGGGRPGGGRAMPPPKNLKVLKVQPQEIMGVMRSYAVGLGVRCDYCHVQGDFASDDKPQKITARMMITMAQEINGKFPDGKEHVTCYTCHRGETLPKTAPPPAAGGQ